MAELITSGKNQGRSSLKKLPVRIDLTAMVDLAFLLITFFILTTTLQQHHAMQLAMPVGNNKGPVPASRTMTICLGKNNQALWYRGLADKPLVKPQIVNYSKSGLRAALLSTEAAVQKATGKSMIVILKASAHSLYDNLVNALDELNITNVPSYAIADISAKDIEMLKQQGAY